jgi:hypothetical protein
MAEDLPPAACQHLPASLADRVALYLSNQLPSYSLVSFSQVDLPGACRPPLGPDCRLRPLIATQGNALQVGPVLLREVAAARRVDDVDIYII